MNPLLLPYIFNILVLVPIGSLTLLGGETGGQLACQGKFPESEGFRTILGSLWMAILIGSGLGLFFPATMSPLLSFRSSTRRLAARVGSATIANKAFGEIPWGIALAFFVIVVSYPWVIPWGQLLESDEQ